MPAVYKSLLKANGDKPESEKELKKNKQRVLILSSRGVTYRYDSCVAMAHLLCVGLPTIFTLSSLTAAKMQNSTPKPSSINSTSLLNFIIATTCSSSKPEKAKTFTSG